MMKNITRRATISYVVGVAIAALGAAINAVRWSHRTSVDAPVWTRVWIGLCAFAVIAVVFRVVYYRNRRDYFAEEMDHRRSLTKDRPELEPNGK
jgi:hypothetical protein